MQQRRLENAREGEVLHDTKSKREIRCTEQTSETGVGTWGKQKGDGAGKR